MFRVKCNWLNEAWGNTKKQVMEPILSVNGNELKVIMFQNGGCGMRVKTCTVTQTGSATFKIPNSIRAFVALLEDFDSIQLEIKEQKLTITAERPNSALQYNFPNIEYVEDNLIADDPKDICLDVPTDEWLTLWKTLPLKGEFVLAIEKTRKSLTFKHSKGRWGAAIQAKDKPKQTKTFRGDPLTAKRIFAFCKAEDMFSTITFMHCGVLKWQQNNTVVYLAPQTD